MKSSKKSSEQIVFMGSGPVSKKSLELLKEHFEIEAVITKPTTYADMSSICPKNTPVHAVSGNKDLEHVISEQSFHSKTAVLIDFGIIISQNVIDSFQNGIVNSHFSILPELRGADPISFAVLESKAETGVSLMLLVEKMDEGPIIAQATYRLRTDETTTTLTEELITLSDQLLQENLSKYISGDIEPKPQDAWQELNGKTISYSRKLTKKDGVIDWSKDAAQIAREIRAFIDWPRSRTTLANIDVIITKAHVMPRRRPGHQKPGSTLIEAKNGCLAVCCGDGNYLCIEQLIPAGKKEMSIDAFLRGYASRL